MPSRLVNSFNSLSNNSLTALEIMEITDVVEDGSPMLTIISLLETLLRLRMSTHTKPQTNLAKTLDWELLLAQELAMSVETQTLSRLPSLNNQSMLLLPLETMSSNHTPVESLWRALAAQLPLITVSPLLDMELRTELSSS